MKGSKSLAMPINFNLAVFALVLCSSLRVYAGGPLFVGSPSFGIDGQPFTWDPAAMPIQYRVDGGPMSSTSGGTVVINNSSGLTRVQSMFQTWQSISTASVSFRNVGAILGGTGFSDGDVSNAAEFNAVFGTCQAGNQSPIIFDANGGILAQLGIDPLVIGFSSQCKLSASGHIVSDLILLNGAFQNGATQPQLTANQFNQAITHEMGHLLGLDHSQINLDLFTATVSSGQFGACGLDQLAGLPLMFPISFCQSRIDAGLPALSSDDLAWISKLYPNAAYLTSYATVSGTIYFSDGQSPVQGVNVIARQVDNPTTSQNESLRIAVSVVSGYRFTGNPGQSVTSNYMPCSPPGQRGCPSSGFFDDNAGGSQLGSRNVAYYGAYDIPVPAGASYTVQVESISSRFTGGSSVGPVDPPIPLPGFPEFWNKQESSYDDPTASDSFPTSPGQAITGVDIILNGTNPRFDQFEDGAQIWSEPDIWEKKESVPVRERA
jgi:hypothetical protein